MWRITFTKEIEVEAHNRKEAIQKAIDKLLEDIEDFMEYDICPYEDIEDIFDVESLNMDAHKAVR